MMVIVIALGFSLHLSILWLKEILQAGGRYTYLSVVDHLFLRGSKWKLTDLELRIYTYDRLDDESAEKESFGTQEAVFPTH